MAYVTSEELQTELENLADELGISISELLEGYVDLSTYQIDKNAITARLDAIDVIDAEDGIESIAEKVKSLNDMFTENGDLATDVLNRIAANTSAIGAVSTELGDYKTANDTRVAAVEANVATNASDIDALESLVASNKTAGDDAAAALADRVTANEGTLDVLNGDETVEGSVDKKIADAKAAQAALQALKDQAQDDKDAELVAADADLQAQIDSLSGTGTGSLGDLESRVKVTEDAINDTLDEDGETVIKGIASRVTDTETALTGEASRAVSEEARIEAKVDALQGSGLATGIICGRKAANKFRLAVGQATKSFDCGAAAGDGEAI